MWTDLIPHLAQGRCQNDSFPVFYIRRWWLNESRWVPRSRPMKPAMWRRRRRAATGLSPEAMTRRRKRSSALRAATGALLPNLGRAPTRCCSPESSFISRAVWEGARALQEASTAWLVKLDSVSLLSSAPRISEVLRQGWLLEMSSWTQQPATQPNITSWWGRKLADHQVPPLPLCCRRVRWKPGVEPVTARTFSPILFFSDLFTRD